jgi:hydrogenase maturation protease
VETGVHTLVACIGNVLMGDDAIGPTVAAWLLARYEFGPGVRVADLGTPGLDLALHLSGMRTVVVVDAMEECGLETGTVRVFGREEILAAGAPGRFDAHAPALGEALLLAEVDGGRVERVCLVGVAARCFEMGAAMDAAIVSRMEEIVAVVVEQLGGLDVEFWEKDEAGQPDLWWLRRQ